MSNWTRTKLAVFLVALMGPSAPTMAGEPPLHGRVAAPAEVAAWNVDVRPDGLGLPPGEGTVDEGRDIYIAACAHCHGDFGEGAGRNPALMGGEGTLATSQPVRTVGSFWPNAPVLFDYIQRTMPFDAPRSLSVDELYAVTAFVLDLNFIEVPGGAANAATLPEIEMPNRDGFTIEPALPDTANVRCMADCRNTPRITSEAGLYGVGIETE